MKDEDAPLAVLFLSDPGEQALTSPPRLFCKIRSIVCNLLYASADGITVGDSRQPGMALIGSGRPAAPGGVSAAKLECLFSFLQDG